VQCLKTVDWEDLVYYLQFVIAAGRVYQLLWGGRAVKSAVTLLAFAVTAFFSCHHYQNCLWPPDVCSLMWIANFMHKIHVRSMWSVRTTACEVPLPHSKPHNCLRVHFKAKHKADKCCLKNSGSGLSSGSCLCQCCACV